MRPLDALVATLGLVLLAAPVSASAGPSGVPSADPDCSGGICDTINRLCGGCIPSDQPTMTTEGERCMPSPCEAINRVCRKAFDVDCVALTTETATLDAEPVAVPAGAEARCMGLPCDVINAVCWVALKTWCVG